MLALLFPGQGSQEVGMGRDACDASPAARAVFEAADRALGFSLSTLCFEGPEEAIRPTEIQQPAILATSIALLRALEELLLRSGKELLLRSGKEPLPRSGSDGADLRPAYVAGHSLGEYTALVAAGSLALEDAVALVHARGRFMQEAVPEGRGAMAAVLGSDPQSIAGACADAAAELGAVVSPANFNSPQQTVIAGETRAVERAAELVRERGARRVVPLPVSAPFHCALMAPAAEKLRAELARTRFAEPAVPVVTNVEAEPNRDAGRIPDLLERQVTAPVRFTESVARLAALGVTRVLEVGPGRVLSGLVARIDRKLERASASTMDEIEEAAVWLAAGS